MYATDEETIELRWPTGSAETDDGCAFIRFANTDDKLQWSNEIDRLREHISLHSFADLCRPWFGSFFLFKLSLVI